MNQSNMVQHLICNDFKAWMLQNAKTFNTILYMKIIYTVYNEQHNAIIFKN